MRNKHDMIRVTTIHVHVGVIEGKSLFQHQRMEIVWRVELLSLSPTHVQSALGWADAAL